MIYCVKVSTRQSSFVSGLDSSTTSEHDVWREIWFSQSVEHVLCSHCWNKLLHSVSRQHVSDIWMSPGWLKGTVDGLCGWLVVVWKEALHLTVTSLCYKLLFSDPSGQTAVQPVYTEVYTILQWWMQHVCDPMPSPPTLPSTPVTSHLSPSIDSAHYRSFLVLSPTEALLFVSSSTVNPVVSIHPKAAAGCLVSITSCWSRGAACSNSRSIVCRFTQIVFKIHLKYNPVCRFTSTCINKSLSSKWSLNLWLSSLLQAEISLLWTSGQILTRITVDPWFKGPVCPGFRLHPVRTE